MHGTTVHRSLQRSVEVVKVEAINNNPSSSLSRRATEPIPINPSSRKSLGGRNEQISTHNSTVGFPSTENTFYNSINSNLSETIPSSCSSLLSIGAKRNSPMSILSTSASNTKLNSNFSPVIVDWNSKGISDFSSPTTIASGKVITTASSTGFPVLVPVPASATSSNLPNSFIEKNEQGSSGGCVSVGPISGNNAVVANNMIITSSDPKLKIAKLAKVLSVVEESPKMERKYEISSPNPV